MLMGPSSKGVPQGTALAPLLWNAFIHALQPASRHLMYGDDMTMKNDVRISESTSHKATIT